MLLMRKREISQISQRREQHYNLDTRALVDRFLRDYQETRAVADQMLKRHRELIGRTEMGGKASIIRNAKVE